MAQFLRSLRAGWDTGSDPAEACARALGAEGVALSVLVDGGRTAEPLWGHPQLSARFEELQFTLGEGPGPDVIRTGVSVLAPDLDRVRPDRWPALLAAARQLGVHGVCCFPLGIGAIRVGVLTLLCGTDRRLSEQQAADARALVAMLTSVVLNGDRHNGHDRRTDFLMEQPVALNRPAVHQATGMISVQLGVSMDEALLRLRAHAYGSGRPLGEVAVDVVARRLRFDDDVNGPHSPDDGKG